MYNLSGKKDIAMLINVVPVVDKCQCCASVYIPADFGVDIMAKSGTSG